VDKYEKKSKKLRKYIANIKIGSIFASLLKKGIDFSQSIASLAQLVRATDC
jgi:hypothetical protein